MRILSSARSPRADDLAEVSVLPVSSWRRLGAVGATMLLLAGLGAVATAGPASAIPGSNWRCSNGLLVNNDGILTADGCSGSGATDVYIQVTVLDQSPIGPQDVAAQLYCASFVYDVPSWEGTGCYVYRYD